MSGGFVIYRSTLKGQRVPKAGGEPEPFENKYFDVLRRKTDGGYEFIRRMWSSNLRRAQPPPGVCGRLTFRERLEPSP